MGMKIGPDAPSRAEANGLRVRDTKNERSREKSGQASRSGEELTLPVARMRSAGNGPAADVILTVDVAAVSSGATSDESARGQFDPEEAIGAAAQVSQSMRAEPGLARRAQAAGVSPPFAVKFL